MTDWIYLVSFRSNEEKVLGAVAYCGVFLLHTEWVHEHVENIEVILWGYVVISPILFEHILVLKYQHSHCDNSIIIRVCNIFFLSTP